MTPSMSEITFEQGEIPICPNCQLKHSIHLLHHTDEKLEPKKYVKIKELVDEIGGNLMITKPEIETLIDLAQSEHKLNDYLTVLRDMTAAGTVTPAEARKIEIKWEKDLAQLRQLRHRHLEPSENRLNRVLEGKPGKTEIVNPKTDFHVKSFRTICPECPDQTCALCAPNVNPTKIIMGCSKEDFKNGKCLTVTRVHKIYPGV